MTLPGQACFVKVRFREPRLWALTLLLVFSAEFFLLSGEPLWATVIALLFAMLGAVCLACLGTLHIDTDGVRERTLFGTFGIRWTEVTRIEYNSAGIVFYGGNKRYGILGMELWSSSERQEALPLLNALMVEYQVPLACTARAAWLRSKNARYRHM